MSRLDPIKILKLPRFEKSYFDIKQASKFRIINQLLSSHRHCPKLREIISRIKLKLLILFHRLLHHFKVEYKKELELIVRLINSQLKLATIITTTRTKLIKKILISVKEL